jgi:hypothetical protein
MGQKINGKQSKDAAIVGDRLVVHQAVGMISIQVGVPVEVALERLQAYAVARSRLVVEVAADVVARRLLFDAPDM